MEKLETQSPLSNLTGRTPLGEAAADPSEVVRHFEHLLSLETDCWAGPEAARRGRKGLGVLGVRSPALYLTGHVPGAINLPRGRIVEKNLAGFPADTMFVVYCNGPHCNGADRAALALGR